MIDVSAFFDNESALLLLFLKLRRHLIEQIAHLEMLGAGLLTHTALDTVGGLRAVVSVYLVIVIGVPILERAPAVETSEECGDRNVHRTTLHTVLTVGARDEILLAEDGADLLDGTPFALIKGLEVGHIREIVTHHIHIAHTGENHCDALEACGKSDSIARVAAATETVKDSLCLIGKVDKATALDGLHNENWLAVLTADLVALARLDRGVLIVGIIELYLHSLDLGVLGEYPVEHFGSIVEGEADVLHLTLALEVKGGFISAALLVFFKSRSILCVHKVEVEVLYSAGLELALEEWTDVLLTLEVRAGKLICENVALAGVSGNEAVADSGLALATEVAVRCIKVIEACRHKLVDHLGEYLIVYHLGILVYLLHRQTHAAEAEILFSIGKAIVFHNRLR